MLETARSAKCPVIGSAFSLSTKNLVSQSFAINNIYIYILLRVTIDLLIIPAFYIDSYITLIVHIYCSSTN